MREADKSAAQPSTIAQEAPERAPNGWARVQKSIANSSGISLLLVEGYQPPALAIANNNSICEALQSSPEHVGLCDPYCGAAHGRATAPNTIIHYRCHAGLQCFAMPVEIGDQRQLAVIGGRAFVSSSDYRDLAERFRSGDLQELVSDDLFRNVIFADEADIDHAALRVARAAKEFREEKPAETAPTSAAPKAAESPASKRETRIEKKVVDAEEIEAGLDRRAAFNESIRRFTEQIDASAPSQTYQSILSQSADLVKAERGSLLLFDESANQLTMTASRGIPASLSEVGPIHLGEGIAGSVLREGRPLVASIDELGKTSLPERRYKTKSFISYPITLGEEGIAVMNFTDKVGGERFDKHDLEALDSIAPQIAVAVDRMALRDKAGEYAQLSITDPLTGLLNRRYIEERLTEEINRSDRTGEPVSFMMLDVDEFKSYNDRYGHPAGDEALELVGRILRDNLRGADVAARYGGEEFSVLLPETTAEEAEVIAERIRRHVEETKFPKRKVTVSIGIANRTANLNSVSELISASDKALYQAKRGGRNRVTVFRESMSDAGENVH